ncbi:MAG: tRNA (adenosine(37)-N6)-threonylcarbamoyltransferase complex dimerization subunit type 1 TsaB [Acidimicrobiia bacterium]
MLVLGIETSSTQVSCAIGGYEGVRAAAQVNRDQRHAELLAPMIAQVCRAADVRYRDLGAIAVGVGPGLFTGLRVGLATAKAMALALRIPMIGVGSLDLLAFPVRLSPRTIVAVMDARRSEVFAASYRATPGGLQRLDEAAVWSPLELAGELDAHADGPHLLVGDGALRYAEHFADLKGVELADRALAHPSAWALVQLAHAQAVREEFVAPEEIHPTYLRKPDAEANWVQRPGSAGGPA